MDGLFWDFFSILPGIAAEAGLNRRTPAPHTEE
jgi:hypothetical protein